jgi:hypothetical protein
MYSPVLLSITLHTVTTDYMYIPVLHLCSKQHNTVQNAQFDVINANNRPVHVMLIGIWGTEWGWGNSATMLDYYCTIEPKHYEFLACGFVYRVYKRIQINCPVILDIH